MRAHHVIAIVAVVLVGLGVTQFFFPTTKVEADTRAATGASMNVLQMHVDHQANLPSQKLSDMTFVFADSD
jgi:hypothetical protein